MSLPFIITGGLRFAGLGETAGGAGAVAGAVEGGKARGAVRDGAG